MSVSTAGIRHIDGAPSRGLYEKLNTRWHKTALLAFTAFVLFHWMEHIVQAYQFFVLHWSRQMSMGLLGMYYPWLMKTEALHYGFALVMLIGLWVLRKGFTGTSYTWWMVDPVLAPFRALHSLLSGPDAPVLVRWQRAHQRRPDLDSADRAASHLQRARVHSDGGRDVLSRVSTGTGCRQSNVLVRASPRSARGSGLTLRGCYTPVEVDPFRDRTDQS